VTNHAGNPYGGAGFGCSPIRGQCIVYAESQGGEVAALTGTRGGTQYQAASQVYNRTETALSLETRDPHEARTKKGTH